MQMKSIRILLISCAFPGMLMFTRASIVTQEMSLRSPKRQARMPDKNRLRRKFEEIRAQLEYSPAESMPQY
ncbi:hypothetical protein FGO68_gene4766 [Halteria grandinella]|uniref:Uncharacterized protein n=1 Tax=Halteria grandinella TaxID=5974 RepID=A0A8J8P599_HALGN|nr:hypothetical protein FGO68_gene4766 [Halteria grandinella]